jgi:transcriptional regulator with XRE-family HTH domain
MSLQIGEKIREARQAKGISLRQLAKQIDIHFSHLSQIENGKDVVGRATLIRIAEELDADPEFMLGEAGHKAMPFRLLGSVAAGVPMRP